MADWNKQKELISIFFRLQKGDVLYWIFMVLNLIIISTVMCLFLLYTWLDQKMMGSLSMISIETKSILEFTNQSLHILTLICISICVFSLRSLHYFNVVKNQRRDFILKAVGLNSELKIYWLNLQAVMISLIATIIGYFLAAALFERITRKIVGEDIPYTPDVYTLLIMAAVFGAIYILLLSSIHIRGKREGILLFGAFFCGILFLTSEYINVILITTVILGVSCIICYFFGKLFLDIILTVYILLKRKHININGLWKITLEKSKRKKNEIAFLSAVISIGLGLSFFLACIEWGMESYLERYWVEEQGINCYLSGNGQDEVLIENWLIQNSITFEKLYFKTFEEERIVLAVSNCKEEACDFYVKEGYLRTIPYNLHRWGVEAGSRYDFVGKELIMDKPMEEKAFLLLNYTCLINAEDGENVINGEYAAVFAIMADEYDMKLIKQFSQQEGLEFMDSSSYMTMVKEVYASNLIVLRIILFIICLSIISFLFSNILSSIANRKKECYLYYGCGAGWKEIKRIISTEYIYVAITGICVSGSMFWGMINLFKLIWFNHGTVYFMGIGQIMVIMLLFLAIMNAECYFALKILQVKNNIGYLRE